MEERNDEETVNITSQRKTQKKKSSDKNKNNQDGEAKQIVLSGLSDEDRQTLEPILMKLPKQLAKNCEFSETLEDDTTHVVVSAKTPKRTLKVGNSVIGCSHPFLFSFSLYCSPLLIPFNSFCSILLRNNALGIRRYWERYLGRRAELDIQIIGCREMGG